MNNNIKETTSLVFVKGKNLINPSTLQNGSLNVDTGQYVSLQNAVVTDFIPVEPGDYVIKFFNTTNSPVTYRMCYYDENKNLIFGMNYANTSEHSFYISSAKYIRFCMAFASFSNLTVDDIVAAKPQLEAGTSATSYKAYVEEQILLKNQDGVFEHFYKKLNIKKKIVSGTTTSGGNLTSTISKDRDILSCKLLTPANSSESGFNPQNVMAIPFPSQDGFYWYFHLMDYQHKAGKAATVSIEVLYI